jgi:hypothetical protein
MCEGVYRAAALASVKTISRPVVPKMQSLIRGLHYPITPNKTKNDRKSKMQRNAMQNIKQIKEISGI